MSKLNKRMKITSSKKSDTTKITIKNKKKDYEQIEYERGHNIN